MIIGSVDKTAETQADFYIVKSFQIRYNRTICAHVCILQTDCVRNAESRGV